MGSNFHEDLRSHSEPRGGSDRQFGFVITAVFAILGLWPLRSGSPIRTPAMLLAALFLAVAFVRPSVLHPLNRLWIRFGMLLGRIVNPIITTLLFFLVFTPAGLLARALGKDTLRLKRDPQAASYWIPRADAGIARDTLAKQF